MAFLKVLSCSLIFIVAGAFSIDAALLAPQQYNVHIILYDNQDVHGEYNINIYILSNTQHIYFYTENLCIIKAVVTNNTQISEEKVFTHRPENFFYETKTYTTTISFPYVLSSGNYTLYLKFFGLLAEDGDFRTFNVNKQNNKVWLAATHYHIFATRRLFPLLKFTAMHASYNISIKHHQNYMALSNMPVQATNIDTNNMIWTHFQNTPKMPDNICLIAGLVEFALNESQNVKFWYRIEIHNSLLFAHTVTEYIMQFLETEWPYIRRTSQTNHIVIPKLLDEEEIKLGFIPYKEADITFNKETSWNMQIEITRIIAYKVVQERLYNVIDSSTWEPWLSKGLATFFGIYAADKIFPHFQIQDFCVIQTQHDFLHWSTNGIWPFTIESEFNSYFEIPRYIKANIMFRKLQNELTDKVFHKGVKMYLNNSEASSSAFWNVMQSTLDKLLFRIKYNLKDKITNWIQLDYYPVINAERNYNINRLNISAENLYTNISIVANIFTRTHSKLKEFLFEAWLGPQFSYSTLSLYFIGENDWILVDLRSGCYRVNYDAENWNRLSIYLNSNFFENIHVLDRAKIIDDSFHFVMTGRLNFTVFLNISHYLSQDTNYAAWYPMFKNLEYISGFFAFPESAPIKEEIELSLNSILLIIEYPRFEESDRINQKSIIFNKCLKEEAARWLCNIDYYHCLEEANNKLISYLFNRYRYSSYKLWPGWKEWTFCKGLMVAENITWMEIFDIYLEELDFNVLKYLACSKNSSIILQYINLMANMTDGTAIKHINSFCFIVARHANNNLVLDFTLDNLEKVKPKEISFTTALTIIINHIYSKKQLMKIKEYVKINIRDVPEYSVSPPINDGKNDDKIIESLRKKKINSIIMYVNHKLDLRWNQLKTQLYKYRYLIKEFDDVFTAYQLINSTRKI